MSKMDALRAMREAKYEANTARASSTARAAARATPAVRATPAARPVPSPKAAPVSSEPRAVASDELCGHRNMSGRTCTRERGHAAKSHRYS
jgi:hypothetical protein